ncbi:MAG: DUF6468 domain-containing protein [Alphaproteobacteria bacterium]
MDLTLFLDLVMIVLLLMTIGYALKLHRDLGRLRMAKDEMAAFAQRFDESYTRAEAGIALLKQADAEIMSPLRREIDRAKALRDELAFLGNRTRPGVVASAPAMGERTGIDEQPAHSGSVAGNPAENAARNFKTNNSKIGNSKTSPAVSPAIKAALEQAAAGTARLMPARQGVIRAVGGEPPKARTGAEAGQPRSSVERELLDAIRAAGGGRR